MLWRKRQRSHLALNKDACPYSCSALLSSICMLTCPYCQSVNPDQHNFCHDCGQSLQPDLSGDSVIEDSIGSKSLPQSGGNVDTYWCAIIQPTAVTNPDLSDPVNGSVVNPVELAQAIVDPSSKPSYTLAALDPSPWDLGIEIPAVPVLATPQQIRSDRLDHLSSGTTSDNLETSPWDLPRSLTPVAIENNPDKSRLDQAKVMVTTNNRDEAECSPRLAVYLDPQCRYKLLDPVVIQLLTPNDSSQVRVIDCQPLCNSPLEILMQQQPRTLDSTTNQTTTPVENRPPGTYPQWQFWNNHGIPKVAQAYIALQVSLPGTVPAIHDSWDHDGKVVTIVEDRHDWVLLVDRWNDPEIPSSQVIYWLDRTLRLWVDLEPWQMRQSLLEIANLLIDEDGIVCFQRLYPETINHQLQLTDLAQMWQNLFDRSDHPPSPSLANLLESIHSGEVQQVEDVRSRLQQIAYELEPKQLSAPLQSPASADLSSAQEAPTIALAQRILNLEDAAATHVGRKREHNEDCFGIVRRVESKNSPKEQSVSVKGLYILCDGMGGHAGGEIASSMTVDLLRDYFATRWGDSLPDEQTIREGIVAANEAVFEVNQQKEAHGSGRMGTTLVLVLVQDRDIAVAHVGDSRCYGVTPTQGLIQLTLDHEVGQQQILRGVDPDIAYGRPDSYQLTQAIGPRDRNYIAPDIRFFELQEDTLILLASDGLTDNQLLENYWLTNVAPMLSTNSSLQDGVDRLIDFANEYNGHDNITAMVIRAKLG
jgi:protein phosphatase